MTSTSRRATVVALVACVLGAAQGQSPTRLRAEGLAFDLTLRGQQRFRVWGFDVYDISLWTAPGFQAQQAETQVLALELLYLRDFQATDIAERSLKEMRRSGAILAEQEGRWMADMQRVLPNVRQGDRLLGLQRPGEAAVFWHNGRPRGEVRDGEFARRFFGIWLAPQTSEPDLRQTLLGNPP